MMNPLIDGKTRTAARDERPTTVTMKVVEIAVDPKRQREQDHDWLKKLERNWNWKKLTPLVMFRRRHRNNELALWKGQHRRTVILSKFGPECEVDVYVVDVWSDEEEDALWDAHLREKEEKTWTHAQKAQNRLLRGDPIWRGIAETVQRSGFSIQWSPNHRRRDWNAISSTVALEDIYKHGKDGAGRLAEVLAVINYCWKGKEESTGPAVLHAVDAFVCRFKPRTKESEWANVLKRLQKIDPERIDFRAKDKPAGEKPRDRRLEALVELHNNACSSFFNGRGKIDWNRAAD